MGCVGDDSNGAVRERQCGVTVVSRPADALSADRHRILAEPPREGVDEVTALPDEAAAFRGALAVPASARESSCVDQVAADRRLRSFAETAAEVNQHRREPAVEPHLDPVVAGLANGVNDFDELRLGNCEWLLDEHGLPGP